MQSELAVSLDWLGADTTSGRFVELPGVRIGGGLMISRGDPREEELLSMSREELDRLYPTVSWPAESASSDSLGMGPLPDTIRMDQTNFGKIWIDLRR
jgi:hypothetical protein